jgi:hypothetical protein
MASLETGRRKNLGGLLWPPKALPVSVFQCQCRNDRGTDTVWGAEALFAHRHTKAVSAKGAGRNLRKRQAAVDKIKERASPLTLTLALTLPRSTDTARYKGRGTFSAKPFSVTTVYLSCGPSLVPPVVVAVFTPKVWNDSFFLSPRFTGGNTNVNRKKCSVPPRISIPPRITLISDPSGLGWTSILSLKNVKVPSGPL